MVEKRARMLALTGGTGQFGRFSGLPKDLPTLNELGIAHYLERLGVPYTTHQRVKKLIPAWPHGANAEFDMYVPSLGLALDINPAWHLGGRSEIPHVAMLDRAKQKYARSAGIKLITLDPSDTTAAYAREVNSKLVPYLLEQGVRAIPWDEARPTRTKRLSR
jgi:hypothetical protein